MRLFAALAASSMLLVAAPALAQTAGHDHHAMKIDAKAALAAAPKQSTNATGKSALDAAMDASGGGADIANNGGDGEEESAKDDGGLLGAFVGATGNKSVLRVVK